MSLPITIPYTFATATTSIPLANLDTNFTTVFNAVNGIGNGTNALANVNVTGGTISNVTFSNVTYANLTVTDLNASTLNGGPLAGFRNRIINGNFLIWQRGTSFSPITSHLQRVADLWNVDWNGTLGTLNVTKQDLTVGEWFPAPTEVQTVMYLSRTVAGTSNTFLDLSTQIESVNTFQNQTITISGWIYGNVGQTFLVKTEQFFGSGGSPSSPVFTTSSAITFTGSWQKFSFTTFVASTSGKTLGTDKNDSLNIILSLPPNNIFNIFVANVQAEYGSVATPFEYRPLSIEQTLCFRYFRKSYNQSTQPGSATFSSSLTTTIVAANTAVSIQMSPPMRVAPTVTLYNPYTGNSGTWVSNLANVSVTTGDIGDTYFYVLTSGATAGLGLAGHYTLSADF
jgi:hypothetical protein